MNLKRIPSLWVCYISGRVLQNGCFYKHSKHTSGYGTSKSPPPPRPSLLGCQRMDHRLTGNQMGLCASHLFIGLETVPDPLPPHNTHPTITTTSYPTPAPNLLHTYGGPKIQSFFSSPQISSLGNPHFFTRHAKSFVTPPSIVQSYFSSPQTSSLGPPNLFSHQPHSFVLWGHRTNPSTHPILPPKSQPRL